MAKLELIRFDWAIKKLLRNKANFGILEGFLSELLQEDISIQEILDSESNKEEENDKHNRVDLLVKDGEGDFIIIEVQNSKEYDYFHRILYGTSKVITEHIQQGDPYSKVKKVISITIAYFDLGQGQDYLYHGKNEFKGVHFKDTLKLAPRQKDLYDRNAVFEIFPEYWLIKVGKFNEVVQSKVDEWIYFLKTGAIDTKFSAKGLQEAKDKLDTFKLSREERKQYNHYLRGLMDKASDHYNKMIDFQERLEKATKETAERVRKETAERVRKETEERVRKETEERVRKETEEKEKISTILGLHKSDIPILTIALALDVSETFVQEVIEKNNLY